MGPREARSFARSPLADRPTPAVSRKPSALILNDAGPQRAGLTGTSALMVRAESDMGNVRPDAGSGRDCRAAWLAASSRGNQIPQPARDSPLGPPKMLITRHTSNPTAEEAQTRDRNRPCRRHFSADGDNLVSVSVALPVCQSGCARATGLQGIEGRRKSHRFLTTPRTGPAESTVRTSDFTPLVSVVQVPPIPSLATILTAKGATEARADPYWFLDCVRWSEGCRW